MGVSRKRRKGERAGAEQKLAAVERKMFRRDLALGDCPAAAADDVHKALSIRIDVQGLRRARLTSKSRLRYREQSAGIRRLYADYRICGSPTHPSSAKLKI